MTDTVVTDHKPISLEVQVFSTINLSAVDLNYIQLKGGYDYVAIKEDLLTCKDTCGE